MFVEFFFPSFSLSLIVLSDIRNAFTVFPDAVSFPAKELKFISVSKNPSMLLQSQAVSVMSSLKADVIILDWPKSLFGFFPKDVTKTRTKFLANPIPIPNHYSLLGKFWCSINSPRWTIKFIFLWKIGLECRWSQIKENCGKVFGSFCK